MQSKPVNVIFDFNCTPMSVGPFFKTKSQKIFTEPKYRANQFKYRNLMFNQQVYRGKTILNEHDCKELVKTQNTFKKSVKKQQVEIINPYEIFAQPPKPGTKYASTMTDNYKEILEDKLTFQSQLIQTEPLLNRPTRQKYIEYKQGTDQGTQILLKDNLFDFNVEVKSVLRVLLNKILEESRMELLEELEIQNLKHQREKFIQQKMVQLIQNQRENAKAERIASEIQRREYQHSLQITNQKFIHQKLLSRLFSKKVVKRMEGKTLDFFKDQSEFFKESTMKIFLEVLPDIYDNTQYLINKKNFFTEQLSHLLIEQKDSFKKEHQQAIIDHYYHVQTLKIQEELDFEKKLIEKEQRRIERRERRIQLQLEREKQQIIEQLKSDQELSQRDFLIQSNNTRSSIQKLKNFYLQGGWDLVMISLVNFITEQQMQSFELDLCLELMAQKKIKIPLQLTKEQRQIFNDNKEDQNLIILLSLGGKDEIEVKKKRFITELINSNPQMEIWKELFLQILNFVIEKKIDLFEFYEQNSIEESLEKVVILQDNENEIVDSPEQTKDLLNQYNFMEMRSFKMKNLFNKYAIHDWKIVKMMSKLLFGEKSELFLSKYKEEVRKDILCKDLITVDIIFQ